jgi:hypothetical protein
MNKERVPISTEALPKTFFPYNPNSTKVNNGRSGINAMIMALGIIQF